MKQKPRLSRPPQLMTPAEFSARYQAMIENAIIRLRNNESRDRNLEGSDGGPLPKDET
jgi:hypothetical protein